MNLFTIDELTTLTTALNSTSISIYAPMERLGIETKQNPIRLKNLVRQAEEKLLALGLGGQDAKELLQPIHELDTYHFWQHQSDGLAIFLSPSQFRYYCFLIADWVKQRAYGVFNHAKPILKFFLNVSKEEQKERFLERINRPEKNWKFSVNDAKERSFWDDYMTVYEDMFNHTSTKYAPWYIIPADRKWFTRLVVAGIIYTQLKELNLKYPKVSEEQYQGLLNAKEILESQK
jgi:hypothetical protein